MTTFTPRLDLPFIEAAQAQKHVTHNAALERLDVATQLSVQSIAATTPPGNPAEGQVWALADVPTGAWAGHGGALAAWAGGGWLFVAPRTGWRAWDLGQSTLYVRTPGQWSALAGAQVPPPSFDNLPGVGINTAADPTNRLAVSAEATLLTHAGAGHQLKLNKAAPAQTASLLYQTAYSGRAEMGLAGNDDFSIKVSPDGNSWTTALRVDAASGAVSLPATPTRQILPYSYRHYLYVDQRWTSPTENSGSRDASEHLGTGAEPTVKWDSKGIFLPAGTTIKRMWLAGNLNTADAPNLDLRLFFQHGAWDTSWNTEAQTTRATVYSQNTIDMTTVGAMRRFTMPLSHVTASDGYLFLAIRPSAGATLQGTRYAYITGAFDVTFPPTA